jgi:hypothetical protein
MIENKSKAPTSEGRGHWKLLKLCAYFFINC